MTELSVSATKMEPTSDDNGLSARQALRMLGLDEDDFDLETVFAGISLDDVDAVLAGVLARHGLESLDEVNAVPAAARRLNADIMLETMQVSGMWDRVLAATDQHLVKLVGDIGLQPAHQVLTRAWSRALPEASVDELLGGIADVLVRGAPAGWGSRVLPALALVVRTGLPIVDCGSELVAMYLDAPENGLDDVTIQNRSALIEVVAAIGVSEPRARDADRTGARIDRPLPCRR
jgi:hypothetical protein